MQQMYSCPYCSAIVAYRQELCTNCGNQLEWPRYQPAQQRVPEQRPDPRYQRHYEDEYPEEQPRRPASSSSAIIWLLAILFIGLAIAGVGVASNGAIFSMFSPPEININISPAAITQGQKAILQWITSGASNVTINPDIGSTALSGNQTVAPSTTTTYTITATNSFGTANSTARITVTPLSPPAIVSFTGTPSSITAGKSASLQWNVTGDASITIEPGIGTVLANGSRQVNPAATATYKITATNSTSSVTGAVTITVIQPETLVINSFTASPSTLTSGQSATIQWDISGADSVTITPGIGEVPNSGSRMVTVTSSTGYCLTATSSGTTKNASTSVIVLPRNQPASSSPIAPPAWLPT